MANSHTPTRALSHKVAMTTVLKLHYTGSGKLSKGDNAVKRGKGGRVNLTWPGLCLVKLKKSGRKF